MRNFLRISLLLEWFMYTRICCRKRQMIGHYGQIQGRSQIFIGVGTLGQYEFNQFINQYFSAEF